VQQLIPAQTRDAMEQRTDWGNLIDTPLTDEKTDPSTASGIQKHE
jgi:hypothetical protein